MSIINKADIYCHFRYCPRDLLFDLDIYGLPTKEDYINCNKCENCAILAVNKLITDTKIIQNLTFENNKVVSNA